jgi:uncharacterized membrane protein
MSTARRPAMSGVRLTCAVLLGLVTGIVLTVAGRAVLAPLVGWDAAALTYLAWSFLAVRRLSSAELAGYALRDEPGRGATDLILIAASVASIGAVVAVIASAGPGRALDKELGIAIGVGSLVLSWLLVHGLYAERYARIYFSSPAGGIDFNDDEQPVYTDFAYLALTLGMTYQVSDTSLKSRTMRSTALRHALLSYLLGAVILAATINLLAGLAN